MAKSERLGVKEQIVPAKEALSPVELGYLSFAMKLAEQMIREIKPNLTSEENELMTKALEMVFVDANASSQGASVRGEREWHGSREVQSMFKGIVFNRGIFKIDGQIVGVEGITKQVFETIFLVFQITYLAFHEMVHILQLAHEKNIAREIPPVSLKMVLQYFNEQRAAFGQLHNRLGYRREHVRARRIPLLSRVETQILFNFANEMSVDGLTEKCCIAGAENIIRNICRGLRLDEGLAEEVTTHIAPVIKKRFAQTGGYRLEKNVGKELSKSIAQFIRSLPNDSNHRITQTEEYGYIRETDEEAAEHLVEDAIHRGSITGDYTFLSLIKDVYGSDAYAIFARLSDNISIENTHPDIIEKYHDLILTAYGSDQDPNKRDEALKQLAKMIGVSIT